MSLNQDWNRFMLEEGLDDRSIFTYLQGLQEIISNIKPKSITEERRLALARQHLKEARRRVKRRRVMGTPGHMAHPFDLGWVNSGADLLDFFDKAKTFVEKKGAGAVKIDGVNVSFKVVGDNENKQFAVDRGSSKAIDIEGITMGRVDDRFPEGH